MIRILETNKQTNKQQNDFEIRKIFKHIYLESRSVEKNLN